MITELAPNQGQIDDKIDTCLKAVVNHRLGETAENLVIDYLKIQDRADAYQLSLVVEHALVSNGLVSKDSDRRLSITRDGLNVIDNGGWTCFLEGEENEARIKLRKLANEERLSAYSVKYYWVPFAISIISLLVAVLALFF